MRANVPDEFEMLFVTGVVNEPGKVTSSNGTVYVEAKLVVISADKLA